jgi:hypothetical protein
MRHAPIMKVEPFRLEGPVNTNYGAFRLSNPKLGSNRTLFAIVSEGGGWDHVSVTANRICVPTWEEMAYIKRLFFKDDEVAMQLHPAEDNYKNINPAVLHLWRPQTLEEYKEIRLDWMRAEGGQPPEAWPTEVANPIPLPPLWMV